jgi:hypothetical protein
MLTLHKSGLHQFTVSHYNDTSVSASLGSSVTTARPFSWLKNHLASEPAPVGGGRARLAECSLQRVTQVWLLLASQPIFCLPSD